MSCSFRFVGVTAGCMILWSEVAVAQVPAPSEQPAPVVAPTEASAPAAASSPQTAPAANTGLSATSGALEAQAATDSEARTPSETSAAVSAAPAAGAPTQPPVPTVTAATDSSVKTDSAAPVESVDVPEATLETKGKGPEVSLGMRVMAGFEYEKDEDETDAAYGFNVRQVRASMKLKWKKSWATRATVDFSDGIDPGSGVQYLRTAYLEYKYSSALRVRVGRYKRPFSHLELQSTGDLPILNRGLLNGLIVEDSAWGDRGIGAMASGKFKPASLGWTFSLTNPAPDNLAAQGVDAIARVTWSPLADLLQVGVHGGNKYIDFDNGPKHFQAVGGDVTLRVAGLEWQLEGMMADLPWRNSIGYGATTLISYTQPVTKHLKLQPVVFGEYADSNKDYEKNESVRLQGGVNLVIRDRFRIMPQVRVTRAVGDALRSAPTSSPEFRAINPWVNSTQYALNLSLAL